MNEVSSFLNPKVSLQEDWIMSTGITRDDVGIAPTFPEIAKSLIELWEGTILISTNPRFTYSFIKSEFKSLGFDFNHKYAAAESLVNQELPDIIPGISKSQHVVDFLLEHMDDHVAVKKDLTPKHFLSKKIDSLPNECGVYLFHNDQDEIIYVGKAIKIRDRLRQHFRNLNNKGFQIHRKVVNIDYQLAHSEMYSLLIEEYLIKHHKPDLNKALKNEHFAYELVLIYPNENSAILQFRPITRDREGVRLKRFTSRKGALSYFVGLLELYRLNHDQVSFFRMSQKDKRVLMDSQLNNDVLVDVSVSTIAKSINPFWDDTYVLLQRGDVSGYCIIIEGAFYGFSTQDISKDPTIEELQNTCEYVHDSEYALSLLISYYHKGEMKRVNAKSMADA